jgi:hypothetical protein
MCVCLSITAFPSASLDISISSGARVDGLTEEGLVVVSEKILSLSLRARAVVKRLESKNSKRCFYRFFSDVQFMCEVLQGRQIYIKPNPDIAQVFCHRSLWRRGVLRVPVSRNAVSQGIYLGAVICLHHGAFSINNACFSLRCNFIKCHCGPR